MTKNQKRFLMVIVIALVAFSVVAFAVPFKVNRIFWLSYIFAVISILSQIYVFKVAFNGMETAKSKFYGFPIAQIGVVYMVAQLVLSLIFMALADIAPMWIVVIIYVLMLAAAAIGFISTDAVRDEIVRQDVKLSTDVSCMTTLRSIIYPLTDQCNDENAKKVLRELSDEFRYSDPVSSEALKEVESTLEAQVGELQGLVMDGKTDDIMVLSKKIKVTLTERNRICKLNKVK